MPHSKPQRLKHEATFAELHSEWPDDILSQIRPLLSDRPNHKLVVLDDDPTGTQTVKDIPVVTDWAVDTLTSELKSDAAGFFILTNSRSLTAEDSKTLHHEIGANIREAASQADVRITLVSRCDSTLRGHYPLETDTLAEELGQPDLTILVPYFEAGGRYTINDIHYVSEGDSLVPAAETPFAQDKAFGFSNSDLKDWVEEMTHGRIAANQVASISIDLIRTGGPDALRDYLIALPQGTVAVVNAACPKDVEVLAFSTLQAERSGRSIAFRAAASIVAARLGQRPQDPLSAQELTQSNSTNGGLIIVGSYVPKSTAQLEYLISNSVVKPIELSVDDLLAPSGGKQAILNASSATNAALREGKDVVVFTSRSLISGDSAKSSLAIGRTVSDALVSIAQQLETAPRYLIAKGGITSSDIATLGLGIQRAQVIGQALPGVPVWQLGRESRFAGMNYVIFPGNVGSPQALGDLVSSLQNSNQ